MPKWNIKKLSVYILTLTTCISLSTIGCSQPRSKNSVQTYPAINPKKNLDVNKNLVSTNIRLTDKVKLYLQLLQSKDISANSYTEFIKNNPTWPNQKILATLMQKALLNETDPDIISSICNNQSIYLAFALNICNQHLKTNQNLIQKAKKAWINSITSLNDEQEILSIFGQFFSKQDHWNRFNRLENAGLIVSATRQVNNLTAEQINLAKARLAFRKKQINAENFLNNLSSFQLNDPSLIYNRLRWLRLQNREDEALKLWQSLGLQTEQNINQKRFWDERSNLIRDFLQTDHEKQALSLISDPTCSLDTCQLDEFFLGGWIYLRKLNNAKKSISYFNKLTQTDNITIKSKGYYWLGKAYDILNNHKVAFQAWQKASSFPTTFYGQISIAKLTHLDKQNILLQPFLLKNKLQNYLDNIQEISYTNDQYKFFKNNELLQAAIILVKQNDFNHARPFLLAYNLINSDPLQQAMNAKLANEIKLPEDAVTLSRIAASKGNIIFKNGWPRPYSEYNIHLPKGLSLSIMRQESSFNPFIVSHAHAYGLMQLLPSTAREICQQNNIPLKMGNPSNLTVAENNIRLGNAYLTKLMKRFHNNIVYTIASYNAGPNRVRNWLNSLNENKLQNQDDLLDWIEMIPITETRNYVQRVMENLMIYQTDYNQ